MTARREYPRALAKVQKRIRDMFDDRVREHEIERSRRERERHAIGQREVKISELPLASKPRARILKALCRIDPNDPIDFFGKRQWHTAAAAARVEYPAAHGDARSIEESDDLSAPVILKERVVVLGTETKVRVRLDGAFVNLSHARSAESPVGRRRIYR